jgi:acetyl-CoA acetyltransferase
MQGYEDVVAVHPVTQAYVRRAPHGAAWFLGRVLAELLRGTGLTRGDVDGLCLSSFTLAPDGAPAFLQQVGLSPRFLEVLPTGGACGVMALRRAARAVQAGDAGIVACLAGDANDEGSFRDLLGGFSTWSRDHVVPHGAGGPNASFAFLTQHYMMRTRATREDFGRICVAQRRCAAGNPLALLREAMTLEDYLAARPVAPPLHLFDCVMPCAGGDGFLVMSRARAASLGLPGVRILSVIERHNAFADDPVQYRGGWAVDQAALWAQAGLGPEAIDLLQTYDDYPVISMMQIEDLGFCAKGEAPAFVRAHELGFDGDFPHNTGGGQLSMGQAGAAGGYLGLVEALRQLLGQGGARQVAGARHAVVSGFGMINYDRGLCTAACVLGA